MQHFYQNIGESWFSAEKLYAAMVAHSGDGSRFVEVGSWKGRSAAYMGVEIINSGKSIRMDCVDTWRGSAEHLDPNSRWYTPELSDPEYLMNEFIKNVAPVASIITPVRKTSVEASQLYENNSLDFVFLDAAHDFDNVLSDIRCWYPKVKHDGVLSGDDLDWDGVQKAVCHAVKLDIMNPSRLVLQNNKIWIYKK